MSSLFRIVDDTSFLFEIVNVVSLANAKPVGAENSCHLYVPFGRSVTLILPLASSFILVPPVVDAALIYLYTPSDTEESARYTPSEFISPNLHSFLRLASSVALAILVPSLSMKTLLRIASPYL